MNKFILTILITIGGVIGAYVPVLFGKRDPLSGMSILFGVVGSLVGIWAWTKIRNSLD